MAHRFFYITESNVKHRLIALSLTALLTGCAFAPSPVPGFVYTEVAAPHYVGDNIAATSLSSMKRGEATVSTILGLFATGDASVDAAAKNGGITKVSHVDYQSKSILGFYATFTTIVYGN